MISNWSPWMDVVFVLALCVAGVGAFALGRMVSMWREGRRIERRIAERYKR